MSVDEDEFAVLLDEFWSLPSRASSEQLDSVAALAVNAVRNHPVLEQQLLRSIKVNRGVQDYGRKFVLLTIVIERTLRKKPWWRFW